MVSLNAMTIKSPRRRRSRVHMLGALSQLPVANLEMIQPMVMVLKRLPLKLLLLLVPQAVKRQLLIPMKMTSLPTARRDWLCDRLGWKQHGLISVGRNNYISDHVIFFWKIHAKYMPTRFYFQCHTALPCQWQLRRAAKARIGRMLQPKSKRKELTPPDYVRKEWENGDKNGLADLLQQCNFQKEQGPIMFGYLGMIYVDVWGSIILNILPTCCGHRNF